MLLPSDVARLVLGYLQQEGLGATSRAFILESPNLREYAEHSSEDGAIPACVFSLFGKNLTTILNEYVAVKAKETCQENQIPAMMTSLWKKLDFTLNQIKSMQNSPAVQQIQRLRTHNSIQNMRHQRALTAAQASSSVCLTVAAPENCVASPVPSHQGMLAHSTPVCYTSQQTRTSTISLPQPGDSTLQIIVPDQRFTPGPLSPARRKCDSPRRRGGGQIGASRSTSASSTLTVESQSQETVAENLSMVIENARDKILNDRSLQEKLAENINKILASDNTPQISKSACSTVEQEQSIDEILGLQGEIHMTDDAIQDILEQTESDPAFQALFDLFDYGRSKTSEGSEQTDVNLSNGAQESDETGHADSATDTGTGPEDSTSGAETVPRTLKSNNVQEAKNKRKSTLPLSTSQLVPAASQPLTKRTTAARGSTPMKKGTTRSKVSVSSKQTRASTSSSTLSEEGASMEVDEPAVETLVESSPQKTPQTVHQESLLTTRVTSEKSSKKASASKKQEPAPGVSPNASGQQKQKTAKQNSSPSGPSEPSVQSTSSEPSLQTSTQSINVPSNESSPHPTPNKVQEKSSSPEIVCSETLTSGLSVISTPSATVGVSQPPGIEPDPSKIVALKIIISDEKEEHSSNDSALKQAVSSISGDHIPTIFLSSPAKSPAKIVPTSSITPEETAQAVSSLQGAEIAGAPTVSIQNSSQLLQARPQAMPNQETGFIQLVPANTTLGATSSYYVVTDSVVSAEQHPSMMLLPSSAAQGSPATASPLVATPPRSRAVVTMAANVSQTFSPASTIIISSPIQPMLQNMAVPVSVFGQNNTGKLTVLPNQMLALPGPALVNQPAKAASKPKLLPKDSVDLGKIGTSGSGQASNLSQNSEQQKSAPGASPGHRRILCFDENVDHTSMPSTLTPTASPGVKERTRTDRTQPAILGSSSAKRRVETVRSPALSCSLGTKKSQKAFIQQQEKDSKNNKQEEMGADQTVSISSLLSSAAQQEQSVRSEPEQRIQLISNTDTVKESSDVAQTSSQNIRHISTAAVKDASQEVSRERRSLKVQEEPPETNPLQDSPGITANKENEVEGSQRESRQAAAHLVENASSAGRPSTPCQGASGKPICKTSPLTKQAVEMLQDIQSQSPVATTPRRKGTGCLDLPLPRTPGSGRLQEDFLDSLRTPTRQRLVRDAEGTPRHLAPPATPDIPSCSPASETGSENSINMAAHTLMILSRAARTGGPLKDSLRQEEAKSSASKCKKRKHAEPSPTAKKELSGSSGSKKKSKKQKKLLDSFPDDLDVDKFLSSLHYDE